MKHLNKSIEIFSKTPNSTRSSNDIQLPICIYIYMILYLKKEHWPWKF